VAGRGRLVLIAVLAAACTEPDPAYQGDAGGEDGSGTGSGGETGDGSGTGGGTGTETGSGTGASSGAGDGSGTGGSTGSCGNGVLEPGEACDGTDLGGETCESLGFDPAGDLACTADCQLDVSGCGVAGCDASAPPTGACGPNCTHCNDPEVCTIDCSVEPCTTDHNCQEDLDCEILCNGPEACRGRKLNCPADGGRCTVRCTGDRACESFKLNCAAGVCTAICGAGVDVCSGFKLNCGAANSQVSCDAPQSVPPETIDKFGTDCVCGQSGC